jgi:hypothetical protein
MATKQTTLNRINKAFTNRIPTYNIEIPLDTIFAIVAEHGGMVVDEAGEAWSGFLCGAQGQATLTVNHPDHKNIFLHVSWYKMESGRYETIVYVN